MEVLDYYKAYENRYKYVHSKNKLWEIPKPSKDVEAIIKKLSILKTKSILDLGCGEGRDAIFLLRNGYNVLAVDYSKSAIDMCNKLTNNMFKEKFKILDLFEDDLEEKFDFIYSVCVLHMFVLEEHRINYFKFIENHLNKDGKALIITMGNGIYEKETDPKDAFGKSVRTNINTGEKMSVANTSCKIVGWKNLFKEIKKVNLSIVENWVSTEVPGFDKVMCVILEKSSK